MLSAIAAALPALLGVRAGEGAGRVDQREHRAGRSARRAPSAACPCDSPPARACRSCGRCARWCRGPSGGRSRRSACVVPRRCRRRSPGRREGGRRGAPRSPRRAARCSRACTDDPGGGRAGRSPRSAHRTAPAAVPAVGDLADELPPARVVMPAPPPRAAGSARRDGATAPGGTGRARGALGALLRPLDRRRRIGPRGPARGCQHTADTLVQLAAIDDLVDLAVGELGLGAAEVLRQLLARGLLDDARPGEGDQRPGLGVRDVAERGERRPDAAGRRVGEHDDDREAGVVQHLEADDRLGHLHQREDTLLHPRATGRGDHDERHARRSTARSQARAASRRRPSPCCRPESRSPSPRRRRLAADLEVAGDEGLGAALGLGLLDPAGVRLEVAEPERVGGAQLGPELVPLAAVGELVEPLPARTPGSGGRTPCRHGGCERAPPRGSGCRRRGRRRRGRSRAGWPAGRGATPKTVDGDVDAGHRRLCYRCPGAEPVLDAGAVRGDDPRDGPMRRGSAATPPRASARAAGASRRRRSPNGGVPAGSGRAPAPRDPGPGVRPRSARRRPSRSGDCGRPWSHMGADITCSGPNAARSAHRSCEKYVW